MCQTKLLVCKKDEEFRLSIYSKNQANEKIFARGKTTESFISNLKDELFYEEEIKFEKIQNSVRFSKTFGEISSQNAEPMPGFLVNKIAEELKQHNISKQNIIA